MTKLSPKSSVGFDLVYIYMHEGTHWFDDPSSVINVPLLDSLLGSLHPENAKYFYNETKIGNVCTELKKFIENFSQ